MCWDLILERWQSFLFQIFVHFEVFCTVVQAYIACLRVKCGTKRAHRKDTCQILQQAADACGHLYTELLHIKISDLLSEASCTSGD